MNYRFGISEKVIIAVITLVVLLMVIVGFQSFKYQKELLFSQFDDRARVMVNTLAASSEYPVLIGNEEMINSIGSKMLQQQDVAKCEIKDRDGNVLFVGAKKQEPVSVRSYVASIKTETMALSPDEMVFLDSREREFEKIGTVYLALSLDSVILEMRKQGKVILLLTIAGIFFIFFSITLLIKFILGRHIVRLVEGIKALASGNLNYRVPVKTQDELGMLALSFNKMTEDLQKVIVSRDELVNEINERRRTEEALRYSEERFRQIADSSGDWIWETNPDGSYVYSNSVVKNILGYEPQDIIGKHYYDFFVPERREEIKSKTTRLFGDKKSFYRIINENLHKDGHKVILETTGVPILDTKGSLFGYRGVDRDITERKRAEENLKDAYFKLKTTQDQLIQAEKLNAVGQLASGVAHEVKNPLAIIVQSVNYLEKKVLLPDQKEVLKMIKDNIMRADNIIRTLVDFSRVTELSIVPEDISLILDSSLTLIQHRTKHENIQIVKELEKDLPRVLVDKNKMEQVFVNVFLNALQAMPNGGRLLIRAFLTEANEFKAATGRRNGDFFRPKEKAVIVEVEDTGIGIPEEHFKRVFDPFFTTKGPRGGAGLGLAVTRNIVTMHKGLIDIESMLNKGTKIAITLKIEEQAVKK